jgi:hypothetical protein
MLQARQVTPGLGLADLVLAAPRGYLDLAARKLSEQVERLRASREAQPMQNERIVTSACHTDR